MKTPFEYQAIYANMWAKHMTEIMCLFWGLGYVSGIKTSEMIDKRMKKNEKT